MSLGSVQGDAVGVDNLEQACAGEKTVNGLSLSRSHVTHSHAFSVNITFFAFIKLCYVHNL